MNLNRAELDLYDVLPAPSPPLPNAEMHMLSTHMPLELSKKE